jgi:UDP-N-acetylmuramoylalanine-D-glutamate ligase
MQPIKTIAGITWYDDGKSTSSQSLGAALSSFEQPIIAICGGSNKGDSFDHLAQLFKHNTAKGIFL